jgi:hypothetical protein
MLRTWVAISLLATFGCRASGGGGAAANLKGDYPPTKMSPAPKDTRLVELGYGAAFTVSPAAAQGPNADATGINVPGGTYWMRLEAFVPENTSTHDIRKATCDLVYTPQQYAQTLPFSQGLYVDAVTPINQDVRYDLRMTSNPGAPAPTSPANLLKVQNMYCYYSNRNFGSDNLPATVKDVACVVKGWASIPTNVPDNPEVACEFQNVAYKPVTFVNTPYRAPTSGPAPGTPGGAAILKCSTCFQDPDDRTQFFYEKYKNGRNAGESGRFPNESACIDAREADTANCKEL